MGKFNAPKQASQKDLQQAMPTPSAPKRSVNFGHERVRASDAEKFEFTVDDNDGPFAPASPQTMPAGALNQTDSSNVKLRAKKKKVTVVEPFEAN